MTSVPNRLQLLNGSRFYVICLLGLMIMASACSSSKPTRSNTRSSTPTKTTNVKVGTQTSKTKVDTVKWTEKTSSNSPITDEMFDNANKEEIDSEFKSEYNIALFIPFDSKNYNQNNQFPKDATQLEYIHFYAGVLQGLEELEREGHSLKINVFDSKDVSGRFNSSKLRDYDLIIGPEDKSQLSEIMEVAKKMEIPLVSPWYSFDKLPDDNHYYIQLKPYISVYYDKLMEFVADELDGENTLLLTRKVSSDKSRTKILQTSYNKYIEGRSTLTNLQEFEVNEDSLKSGVYAYDQIFSPDTRTNFILANWSYFRDEDYVYDCVRKLSAEKGFHDVSLIGMPILYQSSKMNFDYFRNLNMKICMPDFVDRRDSQVKKFSQAYFDKYKDIPKDQAMQGYDMIKYLGLALHEYGSRFQFYLDRVNYNGLSTSFHVEKSTRSNTKYQEDENNFNFFENSFLEMVEFRDNRFQRFENR